jgi:hypothetical protein
VKTALTSLGLLLLAATTPVFGQALGRGGPPTRQGTWQDTTYIDAIIRLDIVNGPTAVLPALTYSAKLMLPVRQFFDLAEIRLASFALRDSAFAVLEPGGVPLRFKPNAHLLTLGADTVRYDSLDVVWWDGDLFVTSTLLDTLLGVATGVEWTSLSATVGRAAGLPVVRRLRREQRRQQLGFTRPAPDVLDLALRHRAVDGAVASWNVTALRRGPAEQLTLDLGLGAEVLGGSAELRPLIFAGQDGSGGQLRWSWFKTYPETHGIRQVRIGDLQSGGLRSRLITGAMVTNAPFIRSSEFDVEHLVNNVPAGWEAELYGGGRLLAYSDADAVGAFRVPLQLGYGQNPYELVLYGPGGETLRKTRTIRVPFSRLPATHLEYAVAAGRCRYDPCDAVASADARYGLSGRVTLQGGWDAFFDNQRGNLWQPYAVVSGAVLPDLALTGEAVGNDHLRATANYEPSLDLRATAGFTRFAASGARISGVVSEATRSEASLFWRPGWMRGTLILQGAGLLSNGPGQTRNLQRVSATTRFGHFRYGLGVLRDHQARSGAIPTGRFAVDASADAALSGPWAVLRSSTVQGQLAFEPSHGLTALRAAIGRRISNAVRLDAGLGWLRGAGLNLELAFSTATSGPRIGARTRVTANAGSEALAYASGSVAYDPRTRLVRLSDVAALGRAGISGVLFQDDNANGTQDSGESGIPGIPVHIGGWPAETDVNGRFAAWGMYASEPLQVVIDTLSFGNPQMVMPAPILRVRPSPNTFGVISVPVMVGAEISGFVLIDGEPVPGVSLVLREMNTGAEIRTTTFRDGGFYRGAVPPGEYEVTLPDAVLERLKATAPALSIFVPPGAGERRFEDLTLRLERRP